jgi:hypothetical protein
MLQIRPCPENRNPVTYFRDSLQEILEIIETDVEASDMLGFQITNSRNSVDRHIGLSFRRKDQISVDTITSVFEKVCQSNTNFNSTDILTVKLNCVKIPLGHGRVKSKGRLVSTLAYLKRSVVEVKSYVNCLAHALIIGIAQITHNPNYVSYRKGMKIKPKVDELIRSSGVNLSKWVGIPELELLQRYLDSYRIVVYSGFRCENIIFDGRTNSDKSLNLLYDIENKHFNVIINLTGAMGKEYVCPGCSKGMSSA